MSICLVDLMPLLWAVTMILSVYLALGGDRGLLVRMTLPALLGLVAYFAGRPARQQVCMALGLFLLVSLEWPLRYLLRRRRARRRERRGEVRL